MLLAGWSPAELKQFVQRVIWRWLRLCPSGVDSVDAPCETLIWYLVPWSSWQGDDWSKVELYIGVFFQPK